ncbi:MAG: type VI secretion system ATPase TssH, partial [Halothiobacillus sp.]
HPLGRAQIRKIVDIQIDALRHRLSARDLHLELTIEALDLLGESGFDPVYGARPLKRAIQQMLENTLAQAILKGVYLPGATIHIDAKGEQLVLS